MSVTQEFDPQGRARNNIYEELGEALDRIDNAIGIRDGAGLDGLKELDSLRVQIHSMTCKPEFENARRAQRRRT